MGELDVGLKLCLCYFIIIISTKSQKQSRSSWFHKPINKWENSISVSNYAFFISSQNHPLLGLPFLLPCFLSQALIGTVFNVMGTWFGLNLTTIGSKLVHPFYNIDTNSFTTFFINFWLNLVFK